MQIIVTRPRAQAIAWTHALQSLGIDAVALPLIEIAPVADAQPVHAAWAALARRALVVFVSANAVAQFHAGAPPGARWPDAVLAGATGPGTAAALRAAGVPEPLIVEPAAESTAFDSEALWLRLKGRDWSGRGVLVVRGEDGRDWLAEVLRAQGATVDFVAAYRRLAPQPDAAAHALVARALADPAAHLWSFSSSEAVGHLRRMWPQADWSCSRAVAAHPRIAQAARRAGFGQVELAAATPAALAARLAAWPSIQSSAP